MYYIGFHSLQGVELIIKALEERGKVCPASADLAAGVAANIMYIALDGKVSSITLETVEPIKQRPKLSLVPAKEKSDEHES